MAGKVVTFNAKSGDIPLRGTTGLIKLTKLECQVEQPTPYETSNPRARIYIEGPRNSPATTISLGIIISIECITTGLSVNNKAFIVSKTNALETTVKLYSDWIDLGAAFKHTTGLDKYQCKFSGNYLLPYSYTTFKNEQLYWEKEYSITSYTNNTNYGSPPGLSATRSTAGKTITITSKHKTGYYMSSVVVKHENAPATTVPVKNNTFVMPKANVFVVATYSPNQPLSTATSPTINGNTSATIKYGTTFILKWKEVPNANSYHEYTYPKNGTSSVYNTPCGKTTQGSFGNWDKSSIGNSYWYYIVPEDSTGKYPSPSITSCGKAEILVAGAVYLYDLNGNIISGWNGKLATSWNKSQVSYQPSEYNTIRWFTGKNKTGTEYENYSLSQFRNTGTLTLYAYATKKQYTVTFDAQGGTCSPTSKVVDINTDLNLATATTITSIPQGKSFSGWSKSAGGSIISGSIKITSNIKLYAVWVQNYNVSYNLNPATLITGTTLTTVPPSISGGEKKKDVDFPISDTTPTMNGHTFLYWRDSSGTTYPVGGTYIKDDGTVLTAIWSSNTYNLTFCTPTNGPGPTITSDVATFNQNYILPDIPPHDDTLWTPKSPFWLVKNGNTSVSYQVGANLPMIYANDDTTITPQWTQITYWRYGRLWIYVPEEGGFNSGVNN